MEWWSRRGSWLGKAERQWRSKGRAKAPRSCSSYPRSGRCGVNGYWDGRSQKLGLRLGELYGSERARSKEIGGRRTRRRPAVAGLWRGKQRDTAAYVSTTACQGGQRSGGAG